MAEDLGERTELPTAKRLEDARNRGQVARSQDLSAAFVLTSAVLLLMLFGAGLFDSCAAILRRLLEPETLAHSLGVSTVSADLTAVLLEAARALAPVLLILALLAAGAHLVQVGFLFTLHPLAPKLSKLNPISGLRNIFKPRSAMKGVLAAVKLALVLCVGALFVLDRAQEIAALPTLSAGAGFVRAMRILAEILLAILVLLVVIGVLDWMFQRWQHRHDLRMTRQEVKDERRTVEGDPDIKARRLRLGRQIVMQQIRAAVPRADVVVTNPTHFSVALQYDAEKMTAPRLLAKGADYMALQIRLVAAAHGVPIVERAPLARAIYSRVEVGREVPVDLYEAVAEILAYVYRLEGRAAS